MMKKNQSKNAAKLIPFLLILIILVSVLTDFRAEMFVIDGVAGEEAEESFETHMNSATYINSDFPINNDSPGINDSSVTNNFPGINDLPVTNGAFINPLTGLATVDDVSRNRPIAISVSNVRGALPTNATNGISQADIVYEMLVESGITRLVALYQDFSNVGVVGSIRSARHYTVEIAEAYDAIFIHAGASPLGFEEIENREITNFDAVTGIRDRIFTRDENRIPGHPVANYHSVITSGASFMQWINTYDFRKMHQNDFRHTLFFSDNPITSGQPAYDVDVRFSPGKSSSFRYDASQKLYYMSQFGSQFTDANNGAPVVFTNLLILEVPVSDLVGHGEGAGRQDMNTVGSGSGYLVSGGSYIKINWYRTDKAAQFIYTYEHGGIIDLGRGKTYIGLVPPDMNQSFS